MIKREPPEPSSELPRKRRQKQVVKSEPKDKSHLELEPSTFKSEIKEAEAKAEPNTSEQGETSSDEHLLFIVEEELLKPSPKTAAKPPSRAIVSTKQKKGKKGIPEFPPQIITEWLRGMPTFHVDCHLGEFFAPRKFLYDAYGANPQHFLTRIRDMSRLPWLSKQEHWFVSPSLAFNPSAPKKPGQPGISFSCRRKVLDYDGSMSVFMDIRRGKQATWTYMGEYEFSIGGVISRDLFLQQRPEVQTDWARRINKLKERSYLSMKARISLRKQGLALDDEQYLQEIKRFELQKNKEPLPPTDILQALANGDEHLDVLIMKCVGYDQQFVQDMQEK